MKRELNSSVPSLRLICVVALLFGAVSLHVGCISSKYRAAPKGIPPPKLLAVAFAPARLEATLITLITYNGPGSWKREAFWDEYVVSVHNPGDSALTVSAAGITDVLGTVRAPRDKPWALEKESKTLERKYRDAGIAFVRYTTPGLIILGTGAVAISSAGAMTAAAASVVAVTFVALPIYYLEVVNFNEMNKAAMEKEFERRRLVLPLTLAPGETRTGSFFFPMVPSPRSLTLRWNAESGSGDAILALDFLHDLHVKAPIQPAAANK